MNLVSNEQQNACTQPSFHTAFQADGKQPDTISPISCSFREEVGVGWGLGRQHQGHNHGIDMGRGEGGVQITALHKNFFKHSEGANFVLWKWQ